MKDGNKAAATLAQAASFHEPAHPSRDRLRTLAADASVIVLAGTFTEWVPRDLNWDEPSRGTARLKIVCGILVILGGLCLIDVAR